MDKTFSFENPDEPLTALAAFMRITGVSRALLAKRASVSEPTAGRAMRGYGVRHATSKVIAIALGLPVAVVHSAERRARWEFIWRAKTDSIEVAP